MRRTPDAAASGAGGRHGSPWRAAGIALVVLLALIGAGMIGAALNAPPATTPPQPGANAAPAGLGRPAVSTPAETDRPDVGRSGDRRSGRDVPARLDPVGVTISAIGVDARVIPLGVTEQGMIEVPPLRQAHLAGWYRLGPAPGEVGNAVLVGHVDSRETGPGVFFRLGALRPGDRVEVTRSDGSVVEFVVDGVKSYPKTDFPTELVYGPAEVPGLRLITCGGDFDERTRSYPDNVIVFATRAR